MSDKLAARERGLFHKKYCFDMCGLHNISAAALSVFPKVKSAPTGKARVQVEVGCWKSAY